MDFKTTLEESNTMSGPLGAVAFVTLKALASAGKNPEEVERIRAVIFESFGALSDDDCNTLADVAHYRLVDRPNDGAWY